MFMKIEFDLPKFEKEISINIIIRKDGEVVETYSESSSTSPTTDMESFVAGLQKAVDSNGAGTATSRTVVENSEGNKKQKPATGNFMDPSLF